MATVIWCDHVKHVVSESRTEVAEIIDRVKQDLRNEHEMSPLAFAYFTLEASAGTQPNPHQRAINVELISTFEAVAGDPI